MSRFEITVESGSIQNSYLAGRSSDLTLFREEGRSEEVYSEPSQTSKMDRFAKIVNRFQPLSIFCKTLHRRCLTG